MKILFSFIIFFLLIHTPSYCQSRITLSGYVTDASSNEVLIGASIFVLHQNIYAITNNYGYFSLTFDRSDTMQAVVSYIGYETNTKHILNDGKEFNVELIPISYHIDEIKITANKYDNIENNQMSVIALPITQIDKMPALLGESDVLKLIQLLPGVQSGNEGTTGYHVRGGNTDQNLVQLDEATIYNPSHLFGLVSIFNPHIINSATLIKGAYPAQYGGRLASILDVTMKEGNKSQYKTTGNIGLITSNLTFEGPISKNQSSFLISGRRTYIDLLLKPFVPSDVKTNYKFYDINVKVNFGLSAKDKLFLSLYKGRDVGIYKQAGIRYDVEFGNTTATLRWNHIFTKKLFSNLSLIYNNYDQIILAKQDNASANVQSGINDVNVKYDFQYFPINNHSIRFGVGSVDHNFNSSGETFFGPGTSSTPDSSITIPSKKLKEYFAYFQDEIKMSDQLGFNIGLRFPFVDSDTKKYFNIEPRASFNIGINKETSIKASYTTMNQYIHLIPSSTASIPFDIWVPSSQKIKPQFSTQYALGLFKNFKNNSILSSVEVYYRDMFQQVLFKEGNQLAIGLDIDNLLTVGKGWSYGAEIFIEKKYGYIVGWCSYTWSNTKQKFPEINNGKSFPFKYDKRHNLTVSATYDPNKKWSFGATFVFTSGSAFTVPTGRISAQHGGNLFEGNYFIYEERNNTRLNPYHRLDVSATYSKPKKIFGKLYDSKWIFSIYNVYSRRNPYFVYFQIDPNTDKPTVKQVSLLPIIPSISYQFKF